MPILAPLERTASLLFKHKEPAGRILSLEGRDKSLMIMAWVSRPLARCCGGFSIAAAVHHYQMCDLDTDNWHARITCGTLVEVSLTDVPSNSAALVKTRIPSMPASALATQGENHMTLEQQIRHRSWLHLEPSAASCAGSRRSEPSGERSAKANESGGR
jgi:hypothetical protein